LSLSYEHDAPPKDLRGYDDWEVVNMQNGVAGLAAAALAEVVRLLRKLVKKLHKSDSSPTLPTGVLTSPLLSPILLSNLAPSSDPA
jgi:hypothetical protein